MSTPKTADGDVKRPWRWQEGEYEVIRSAARSGPGCHDNCGVLLYVKNGKLEKIEGDSENPYNQGRLCPRCLALKEMVYHPDRIVYPMVRSREDRGRNAFKRVSWEEATDVILSEMGKVIDTYGAESIWVTQGTGRDINGYGPLMARYLGTPNYGTGFLSGIACYAPRRFSTSLKSGGLFIADYSQYMPDRYDDPRWHRPDYILIWGNNPVVANSDGTLGHWVVECMKRGSKLITIDPKLTWLAGKSDVFLQLRPGTDTAIALAICNHIVANNLQDQEFCDCWCYGYNEFAEHLTPYTAEWAAPICGVDADLIKEAAIKIGEAESCCLQWGVAMDHTSEGFVTGMAAYDLMALTGNFEKPGAMVDAPFAFGVNIPWSAGDDWELCTRDLPNQDKKICGNWPANKAMQAISPDDLLVAMETGKPYPIKAMWMMQNNALACMGAAPQRIIKALQENMDFNVVVDLFLTPTALACADVLLPAACFPERIGIYGHQPYLIGTINQAIEPQGEAKPDQVIMYEIGKRFGRGEGMDRWQSEEEFYDFCLRKSGFTYETLQERCWAFPEFEYDKHKKGLLRPDGQPGFNTPTGRYSFYSIEMVHFGFPPFPTYEEPPESPVSAPDLAERYPLVLTTGARHWGFFHSEHRQSPSMRRLHPEPTVLIHPETANRYGIENGDWVKIENQFGSCRQRAELSVRIRKDTVSADHAWWFPERDPDDGTLFGVMECNINKLIPMRPGKSGLGASYKSQLCAISKIEE